MSEPPFDLPPAHRWFAIELNNLSWSLIEAESRTGEEEERMIHAAHASLYHWLHAGDSLNHLRAQCLVTTAYLTAGWPETASRCTERLLELHTQVGDAATAFDDACVFGCAANACRLLENDEQADRHCRQLRAAFDRIDEEEDRKIVRELYLTAFR